MATEVEIHIDEGQNLLSKRTPTPEPQRETSMTEPVGAGGEGAVAEVEVIAKGEGSEDNVPEIPILTVINYKQGDDIHPYLPMLGITAEVSEFRNPTRREKPMFKLVLQHGPFEWTLYKQYHEFRSLRGKLQPLRVRVKTRISRGVRRRRERAGQVAPLPHLLTVQDMNPRGGVRIRNQIPKVRRFMNAVLHDRHYRSSRATMKFLEVSRVSFVYDLGEKLKEGSLTKRSGGHHRVTNCLGCTVCCLCKCSVWRERWFVLKDSYIAYLRSDNIIGGVLLFEQGMTVESGIQRIGIINGVRINTLTRDLLVRCGSQKRMRDWRDAVMTAMQSNGSSWVEKQRHNSFASIRENSTVKWFVDGEGYMSAVADAIVAAKEEIYITDWMFSTHIFLKRHKPHDLEWRLDKMLLKKAEEGVRVFIQLYKEFGPAINLGGEFAAVELQHKNIVVLRHPDHVQAGVYLWAHHEKIVVIDQSLAFVGGIDLAFGRWDDENHILHDHFTPPKHTTALGKLVEGTLPGSPTREATDDGIVYQKWVGKDYYNPFIKDFIELTDPLNDQLTRTEQHRMPWHDIACCVYGPAARDVGRHFIQRHNFTKHEQEHPDTIPYLLPRRAFNEEDVTKSKYLSDLLQSFGPSASNATVQILRSSGPWSAGFHEDHVEHSILNAYLDAIEKAEHFIYIENQFFISSLKEDDVKNGIAEALRQRIVKAYKEGKKFRVIVVMPLMPSFEGAFGESSGSVLEAVIHWNYRTISRGEDSLVGRLIHEDHIPLNEVDQFFTVYGLRSHGVVEEKLVTEVLYVHSKCMIVDDKLTIIGSANVNDRSQLGDRDSEVAILVEDKEMVESTMNGEPYSVGKFSHALRCHLFKEHLGLLESQKVSPDPDIDVTDPVLNEFYVEAWLKTAESNTNIYEQVFGGKILPTDTTLNYTQLANYKQNPGFAGRDVDRAKELLTKIQGTLVRMPLRFLEEEDLLPNITYKEYYAPEILLK